MKKRTLAKILMCCLLSFILIAPIAIADGVALANENIVNNDNKPNMYLKEKREEAVAAIRKAAGKYFHVPRIYRFIEPALDTIQQAVTLEQIENAKGQCLDNIRIPVWEEEANDARNAIDKLPNNITDDFDIAVLEPLVVEAKNWYDNCHRKDWIKDRVAKLNYAIDSLKRLKEVVNNARIQAKDLIDEVASQVMYSTDLSLAVDQAKINIDKSTSRDKVADALASGLVKIKEVMNQ